MKEEQTRIPASVEVHSVGMESIATYIQSCYTSDWRPSASTEGKLRGTAYEMWRAQDSTRGISASRRCTSRSTEAETHENASTGAIIIKSRERNHWKARMFLHTAVNRAPVQPCMHYFSLPGIMGGSHTPEHIRAINAKLEEPAKEIKCNNLCCDGRIQPKALMVQRMK